MMEVFVSKDGEKSGPMQVFELKNRVDSGEFSGEDLGWIRGMDEWKPLAEIEPLDWLFAEPEVEPPPLPDEVEAVVVRPWIRFWARLVDWHIVELFVVATIQMTGGLEGPPPAMMLVSIAFGWGLLEAAMLSRWGTTPGKAMLGIRVERIDGDGGIPTMSAAVKRSLLLVMFGWGMGLQFLIFLAWAVSYVRLRQAGRTLWDEQTALRVHHQPVTQTMVVRTVLLLVFLTAVSTWLNWDDIMAMAEEIQKGVEEGGRGSDA